MVYTRRARVYGSVSVVRAVHEARTRVARATAGEGQRGSGAKWRQRRRQQRSCIDVRARLPPPAHTPAVSCERVARRFSLSNFQVLSIARTTATAAAAAATTAVTTTATSASDVLLRLAHRTVRCIGSSFPRHDFHARLHESSIARANSFVRFHIKNEPPFRTNKCER